MTAIKRPSGVLVYTRRGQAVLLATVVTGVAPAKVGCTSGLVESKYATPRQRSQASAFEFTSAFQICLPESASMAKMLLCGVHKKTLFPTCSGVIWSSAPLPLPVVKSPVLKRQASFSL
ncbi:Uncharacterised protein [Acinetobacter baumannii]|nr:Uncharacterised protein [Acinetobacter baumannii]